MVIFWLLMATCHGSLIPDKVGRDLPTLTATIGATETTTYSNTPVVVPANGNPYIETTDMPENLVFIIIGSIILLALVSFTGYWIVSALVSRFKAKRDSEKYYYNPTFQFQTPFHDRSSVSLSSSSILESKSTFSNMSQMTLNQPLGKSYRNAQLDNNRGSMFFSPTSDFLLNGGVEAAAGSSMAGSGAASDFSIFQPNDSSLSLLEPGSGYGSPSVQPTGYKLKRPPSQYLEDLLDD